LDTASAILNETDPSSGSDSTALDAELSAF
jgi:hypothetical protein